MPAYLRRKQWEHKHLAVQVINTLGEALQGGKKDEGQMSLRALAAMGFKIEGLT